MIEIEFSEQSIRTLKDSSINHPHPTIRLKAMALLLKSTGMSHGHIASTLDICGNTLRGYLEAYNHGGLKELTIVRFKGPVGKLVPFEAQIRKYINETPPASIKQARSEIEKLTGISLSKEAIRVYLKSLGVRCRKVGGVPAKFDREAQEKFKTEQLEPRLQEAEEGKREVHFMDAAHFVLGPFLAFLWSFKRVFVRTPSGRQRFNVLGSLNAITKQLTLITNDSYITSIQVCELLVKIKSQARVPVTIILDNARYQRCKLVMELAEKLEIELLFLPPYSPNLNLIERVWKFTKKECLNSRYYSDFNLFRGAIKGFLDTMHETHEPELKTLLTLKFQTFDVEQIKLAA